uniref:Guanine nucleotide-binding protein subunit beta-like protein n=1 Tax=Percolomonas cosmopolitus TaxID=63605 RepID=A0A7S1KMG8_9EUKA
MSSANTPATPRTPGAPDELNGGSIAPIAPPLEVIGQMHHSFSFPSYKRNNLHFVDESRLVSCVGNTMHLINLPLASESGDKGATYEWILNKDDDASHDGVGVVAVHPSKEFIALAENLVSQPNHCPNIYILNYPQMDTIKTLKNGTKQSYTAMAFNAQGDQLATVGGAPDFMLTIWNWDQQRILLRYKAFGQDVYNVSFSNYLQGVLTTSGLGHIKFWKMSHTFTGLKLKGNIGKFGKVDISDIAGYVELPDGKVLSGSEQGNLILWEGNLVKVLIQKDENTPCHTAPIEFITLFQNEIITAARDGYIKYWSFDQLDLLEPSDTSNLTFLQPIQEFYLPHPSPTVESITSQPSSTSDPVEFISLVKRDTDNLWVAQDGKGAFWEIQIADRMDSQPREHHAKKILDFNSGHILDVVASPIQHLSAAASSDGSVRLVNHHERSVLYYRKFNSSCVRLLWNPVEVDPTQTSITCGFDDGVVRYLIQGESQWHLAHAVKPHKSAIVSLAYTSDGSYLVSASKDEVFFFRAKNYEPIGYTVCQNVLQSTINDMHFHEDSIVLSLDNGKLMKMLMPDLEQIDNSETYEFQWDKFVLYNFFQWVKPPPKPKKKKKKDDSEDQSEDEEENSDDEGQEEEDEEEVVPPTVPVLSSLYTPDHKLLVSFDKPGGVFRYSGHAWESDRQSEQEYPYECLNPFDDATTTCMRYSLDGNFLIIAYSNGKVRFMDANSIGTAGGAVQKQLASLDLHDALDGVITRATTSHDDAYLISVSTDGGFFVQKLQDRSVQLKPEPLIRDQQDAVEDIVRSDHWSIEEARIKEAELKQQHAAETRQEARRRELRELKEKFLKLIFENEARDRSKRIKRKDLQIDVRLEQMLATKLEQKLDLAQKELAWDTTKTDLKLRKVKGHFLDCLDVERIVLRAFRTGRVVSTFRTRKLRDELLQKIEEVHALINDEVERKRQLEAERHEQELLATAVQEQQQDQQEEEGQVVSPQNVASLKDTKHKTSTAIQKAEENQRKRKERQAAREELETRKPDNEDDPRMLAEIQFAENNMGDYKLKTDPNFILPENQRMTAEKKLRQMILLEESAHTLRMVFNQSLLSLRDTKAKFIDKFKMYNEQINQINEELRVKEPIVEPSFEIIEYPEQRYAVSSEELQEFHRQKELAEKKKLAQESGKFLAGPAEDDAESIHKSGPASVHSFHSKRSSHTGTKSIRGKDSSNVKERMLQSLPVSDMEIMEQELKRHSLLHEKQRLLLKMQTQVDMFDQKIDELRREKFKLEADLKNADLRLILLYKELDLLKEFEIKDNENYSQLETKRQERDDIVAKIQNCQDRLAEKKEEITNLVQEQKLGNEFMELVPENHPAHQQLFQVYKKSKKTKRQDDDSDSESDSDDDESDLEEDADGDSPTMEKKPEAIDCTDELWYQVIALRNKRIEQERTLDTIAKSVEQLKKEREGLVKQQKIVNHALKKIEEQIKGVQKDKQHKLNELETVVVLKFNQIQGLLQNRIPSNLQDYVVFTNGGLKQLAHRIQELKKDSKLQFHRHVQHQKKMSSLQKEQKQNEDLLESNKQRVQEVQMLKFGQIVDLEALENASIDKKAEELKTILSGEEQRTENAIKAWDRRISDEKDRLTQVTQENTYLLRDLSSLRETQQDLEKELDESQKTMVTRVTKNLTSVSNTRKQLKDLVVMQAREIEIAKNEIAILRSKHGHVYKT